MRLGVQADRDDVAVAGDGAGPVAGAVRDAPHYVRRPLRGAAQSGHDWHRRQAEPGQRDPGAPARSGEFVPPFVDGPGDDGFLLGKQRDVG